MSGKERKRMVILSEVKQGRMSLAEAGRVLGLSYRQSKRVWQRFKKSGEAGLVHRSRGRPGVRRKDPKVRRQALARYEKGYADFGPTLAAEHLQEEGLEVDHETLRRWLIEKGLWQVGRKRHKHRSWRERKECFGQMVQMDGSHHDWFEGRRDKAVLMVMVDDATNWTVARFSEEETTRASYDVLEQWVKEHGMPGSLYVDRDSIYRCERIANVEEQIAGKEPQTQFGRAMEQMGIELILAHSPQAKGRVERRNGLLQDRLVKALRLARIQDLEKANEFLEKKFLPQLNGRFTVPARSQVDAHRRVPCDLHEALSWEDKRVVGRDWTVAWKARWFQIDAKHERLSLVNRKVVVRELRCGQIQLLYEGKKLVWKELPTRPVSVLAQSSGIRRTQVHRPPNDHPWRKAGRAAKRRYWHNQKAQQAAHQAGVASGKPPLRSGFPPATPA